jgi:hypothetical protein
MVQTRSASKRQQAEEGVQTVPKNLVREATVVEITTSTTGLGTHIRWLRPSQGPNEIPELLSPDLTLDSRFLTPAPETPVSMKAPPRLSRQRRIGNPGIFNTGTTLRFNLFRHEVEQIVESARVHDRDLLTEFERYSQDVEGTSSDPTPTDTFGNILQHRTLVLRSPFPVGTHMERSTPPKLGPHGTHLTFPLNNNFSPNTGHAAARQLGPHGTHLDISQDDVTSQSADRLITRQVRGLGPSDTVLIGPDGQALVPGTRLGAGY